MLWRIALRDDLLLSMATDPEPYWASTDDERDWALTHLMHRPREDYDVVQVPGPVARAIADERERRRVLRANAFQVSRESRT